MNQFLHLLIGHFLSLITWEKFLKKYFFIEPKYEITKEKTEEHIMFTANTLILTGCFIGVWLFFKWLRI